MSDVFKQSFQRIGQLGQRGRFNYLKTKHSFHLVDPSP